MRTLSALVIVTSLLAGCSTPASVEYEDLASATDTDKAIPYQLTDTTVVIGVIKPDATSTKGAAPIGQSTTIAAGGIGTASTPPIGTNSSNYTSPSQVSLDPSTLEHCNGNGCGIRIAAVATPVPFEGITLAIVPENRRFVVTTLSPTYYPQSLRLKALAVDVTDQRKEAIDTVAALAIGIAKIATGAPAAPGAIISENKLSVPVILNLDDLRKADVTSGGAESALPGNSGWTFTAKFLDREPEVAGFKALANIGSVHHAILTSICRPLQINLIKGSTHLTMALTVADPKFLVAIPFPVHGQVNFDTLCGASVVPGTATGISSTSALATDFFTQVLALRNAADNAAAPAKVILKGSSK